MFVPTSLATSWKLFKNNPVSYLGEVVQALLAAGEDKAALPADIDGVTLLERVLVVGPCRAKRAEKTRFENDPAVLSEYLWRSYGKDKVMHFDLAPKFSQLDMNGLANSVVQFDFHRPTARVLREAVDAVVGWLALDDKNVAIITCSNGIHSSVLVAACVAARLRAVSTTREGVILFFKLRLGWNYKYGTLLQRMPPSYDRLLSAYQADMDDIEHGVHSAEPTYKLRLLAVVMKHLPLRPLDGTDYVEPSCKLRVGDGFATIVGLYTTKCASTFQYDPSQGSWGFKLGGAEALAGDFCLDLSVGDDLLFSFPMHTSQFSQGAFHFRPDDVDEERRYALPGDFVLELAFDNTTDPVVPPTPAPPVALLSSHHVLKPSQRAVNDLIAKGVSAVEASFALQRAGNDVKRASGYFLGQPIASPSSSPNNSVVLENLEKNTFTPAKRRVSAVDDALSPFLRETIGHGLSSPVTPTPGGAPLALNGEDINPTDMDAVLLKELGHLVKKDAMGLLESVRKLNLGGKVTGGTENKDATESPAEKPLAKPADALAATSVPPPPTPTPAAVVKPDEAKAADRPEVAAEGEEDNKVGDSDKYRPFFKALKMGVPLPAVKMRMTREGVCPDILDLGPDAPLSRARELEDKFQNELQSKANAAAPTAPARKTRFRWEAIPEEKLRNRATIWASDAQQQQVHALNTSDLEALFVEQSLPAFKPPAPVAARPASASVRSRLDPRRAQSVSIGMVKLKLTAQQLVEALERFDEKVLTPTAVQIVQGCSLVPTVEEANMFRSEGDTVLAPPDAFLRDLSRLSDAASRVEAMAFVYVCDDTMTSTLAEVDVLAGACKQVRESPKLKSLLHVVLVVGNRINGQEGAVRGFTLASLLKLSQTKSLNKSMTVLEYLVHFISKKTPDVFGVENELSFVFKARKVQLATLGRQERDLKRGMDAVLRMPQLTNLSAKAVGKLALLESRLQEAREQFCSVVEYFGEDEQMTSNEFFDRLASFVEALSKTRQAMEERERRAARAKSVVAPGVKKEASSKALAAATAATAAAAPSTAAENLRPNNGGAAVVGEAAAAAAGVDGGGVMAKPAIDSAADPLHPHLSNFYASLKDERVQGQ